MTVEIPIHPDFLGMDDKGTLLDGEMAVSEEKMNVSDSNATFEYEESIVSSSKVSFEGAKSIVSSSKVSFEHGESIVSPSKVSFEEILKTIELTERTRENISLLRRAITDDIFSRADIVKLLRLSKPGAGKLIKKMKDYNLIVPVSGHGKGKYRFITEETV